MTFQQPARIQRTDMSFTERPDILCKVSTPHANVANFGIKFSAFDKSHTEKEKRIFGSIFKND